MTFSQTKNRLIWLFLRNSIYITLRNITKYIEILYICETKNIVGRNILLYKSLTTLNNLYLITHIV